MRLVATKSRHWHERKRICARILCVLGVVCLCVRSRACVVTSAIAIRQFQLTSHCSVDAVVSCHVNVDVILYSVRRISYLFMPKCDDISVFHLQCRQIFSRFSTVFKTEKKPIQTPIQIHAISDDNGKSTQNSSNLLWESKQKNVQAFAKLFENLQIWWIWWSEENSRMMKDYEQIMVAREQTKNYTWFWWTRLINEKEELMRRNPVAFYSHADRRLKTKI